MLSDTDFTPGTTPLLRWGIQFNVHAATIQMVLSGELYFEPVESALNFVPVATDSDWVQVRELVLQDHAEGARTQGAALSEAVTDGILSGYRAKAGPYQFFHCRD